MPGRGAFERAQERHNQDRAVLLNDLRQLQREIPAGRYAVIGDSGLLEWYSVHKYKTRTVVVRLGLETGPFKLDSVADELNVLSRIAADPDTAAQRYEDNTNQVGG